MSEAAAQAAAAGGPGRSRYVNRMFGRIAPRYDLMNSLMTLGRDRSWRRLTAILAAPEPGGLALDLGTGSGELALELANLGCRVVGLDSCLPMMEVARQKGASRDGGRVCLAGGDALHLPFPETIFDCITAGFALRNLADLDQALREMYRVLKPRGRLAALELTPPKSRIAHLLHRVYAHRCVPLLGRVVGGGADAYTYLPQSVDHFPDAEALRQAMLKVGFVRVSYRRLALGMVAIHLAEKGP